jgi:hypothetical protein
MKEGGRKLTGEEMEMEKMEKQHRQERVSSDTVGGTGRGEPTGRRLPIKSQDGGGGPRCTRGAPGEGPGIKEQQPCGHRKQKAETRVKGERYEVREGGGIIWERLDKCPRVGKDGRSVGQSREGRGRIKESRGGEGEQI